MSLNNGEKVDRVIDVDFGANLAEVLKLIRVGGEIVTYSSNKDPQPKLPFGQMMYLDLMIRLVIVYAMPETAKQAAIADINDKLAKGELQHRIAHVLDFKDMVQAHELIEQGWIWRLRSGAYSLVSGFDVLKP